MTTPSTGLSKAQVADMQIFRDAETELASVLAVIAQHGASQQGVDLARMLVLLTRLFSGDAIAGRHNHYAPETLEGGEVTQRLSPPTSNLSEEQKTDMKFFHDMETRLEAAIREAMHRGADVQSANVVLMLIRATRLLARESIAGRDNHYTR